MGVELMDSRIAVVLGIAILIILGLTAYLAFRTAILRESQFRLPDGRMTSYSLGRSQMAFWFINIFVSYLFIGLPVLRHEDSFFYFSVFGSVAHELAFEIAERLQQISCNDVPHPAVGYISLDRFFPIVQEFFAP